MKIISKNISYLGRILHYRMSGEGKSIILLHGFGENNEIWDEQLKYLSAYFKVITPDLPGSGESEPLAEDDFTIDELANSIHSIVQSEQIEDPLLLGHSMGGYVTLSYLKLFPNTVKAAGLVHSTSFSDSDTKRAARLKSISFIEKNGAAPFLKMIIPGLFHSNHHPEIAKLTKNERAFTPQVLISYYKAIMNRANSSNLLSECKLPFLIIAGVHDQVLSYHESLQQSYLASQTWFHTLRSSAHMGMIEESDRVNKILYSFAYSVFYS